MNLATSTKKLITAIAALLLAVVLAFTMSAYGAPASAEETTDYANWHETVSVTNSQFESTGSESVPLPSDWTGAAIASAPSTGVIAGVMDLDNYVSKKDEYKLSQYDDYKNQNPDSPFGTSANENDETNRKVLLINANGTETAYGFTSADISLSANSFYKLTVWVKSGANAGQGGAAVLVGGVSDEAEGITNIRTSEFTGGDKGWFEYAIYFATDYTASTATIKLQLGSDNVGGRTKGYAMFDNVNLVRLNAQSYFAQAVPSERAHVIDLSENVADAAFNDGGEFETLVSNFGTNIGNVAIENGANGISGYGAENAVYAPHGNYEAKKNVLVISTYDSATDTFKDGYVGVKSNDVTLKRFAYYRLSVLFYAESLNGSTANMTLSYKSALDSGEAKTTSATLAYSSGNPGLFGWQEASMVIKGSDLSDFTANVILSIGTASISGSGVLFVDGVKLIEISSSEYSSLTESATASATLDTATDSTGVSNGWLNSVGTSNDIHDYSLNTPLVPANWSKKNTAQVGTSGFSTAAVSTDDVVSGLVKVEDLTFLSSAMDKEFGNALKIASETNTAVCYASEVISLAADSYNTLAIKLVADDLKGYGANLVLKRDSKVVGTIEQIAKSGTYTFYVKNGSAETSLYLELWLGLNDRVNNASKLASGAVYFTSVTLKTDSTAEIFDAKAESYKTLRANAEVRAGVSFATLDLTDNFTLFDSYADGTVKTPYNWTLVSGSGSNVVYGIFDATNREGDATIPASYDNKGKQYAVMLQNVTPTYSTLTLDNAFTFTASSYYKLTVSVKAAIPAECAESKTAIGASVYLSTSDDKFTFTSTSETVDQITDNEAFKTFTFYIKGGDADTTANLVLALGGSARSNQYCVGRLYLNDITVEDLSNLDYDELVADLDDGDYLIDSYSMRVDYSSGTTDEEPDDDTTTESDSSLEWWLVPSILLAVAIVLAVVGTIIRKAIARKPKKPGKTPTRMAYDRRSMNENDDTNGATKTNADNDSFEDFDDTTEGGATELDESEVTEVEKEEADETSEEVTEDGTEEATEENAEAEEAIAEEEVAGADEATTEVSEEQTAEAEQATETASEEALEENKDAE